MDPSGQVQHTVTDTWSMSGVTEAYDMPPTNVFHLPGCWKMGQRAWSNAPLGLCSGTTAHNHNQMSMSSWLRRPCSS